MERSLCLILGLFGVVLAQTLEPAAATEKQCGLPVDQGSGDEQHLKFYYSEEEKVCLPFYYKGAEGNDNRFDNDTECMRACSESYADAYPEGAAVCVLPADPGLCMARLIRLHYSQEEGTCRTFLYGGCGGNGNRFESREDCLRTCQGRSGRSGGGDAGSDTNPDAYNSSSGLVAGVLGGCILAVALVSAIAVLIQKKTSGRKKVPTKEIEMS